MMRLQPRHVRRLAIRIRPSESEITYPYENTQWQLSMRWTICEVDKGHAMRVGLGEKYLFHCINVSVFSYTLKTSMSLACQVTTSWLARCHPYALRGIQLPHCLPAAASATKFATSQRGAPPSVNPPLWSDSVL